MIHAALLVAVHAQPLEAETATGALVPPLALIDQLMGEIVYEHWDDASDCVTVTVCPATVIVPVRSSSEFVDTLNPTDPLSVPDEPDVTVIHGALLLEVHGQPAAVVTVTLPVPPPAATDWVRGVTSNVHIPS